MKKLEFFILTWKKLGLIVVLEFLFIVLHNLVSAFLGMEEGFFFILAVLIIPIYFIIAILVTLVDLISPKKKKKKR